MTRPDPSAKIYQEAKTKALDFTMGTEFRYSNTGYIVLGRVVERAAGKPFPEYVMDALLRPAGMAHSGVIGWGARPKALAYGYTHGEMGCDRLVSGVPLLERGLERVLELPLTPPEGDGGLYSAVDDLLKWSREMDGGALVPKTDTDVVFTPGLGDYAYGWFVDRAFDRRRFRHTGSLPGYTSDFIKFPDEKITIVLLTNLDRTRLERISRDVSAIVLGTPFDMPISGTMVTSRPSKRRLWSASTP